MAARPQDAGSPDAAAVRSIGDLPVAVMEAIIQRFNERVNAAQEAVPASRAWVREALRRHGGRRCPVRMKRLTLDLIVLHGDALADLLCEHPDDAVAISPYEWSIGYRLPGRGKPVNTVAAMTKESQWVDEWGTRWAHAAGGVGAIPIAHPLRDWAELDEYLETRMPDPHGPGRLDEAARLIAAHRGRKYCIGMNPLGLLEIMRNVRGMQELFVDLHTNERDVRRLLDALAAFFVALLEDWARIGADAVMFGDDWGTQTGLQIAPTMWRELFKPYYRELFAAGHAAGLDIIFHSCGKVIDIVGDLIDVGVDILDPLQPGCMDPQELARLYGGRISFSGAVDIQGLMVFGTPGEVRREIHRLIEILGRPFGGGLLIGPANSMTPDIPLANLRAMIEAAHEHER